jgi:DNA repair protein SbcC/Rad50
MKIEKLRFKNLNSLYGEWEIDFTMPEFVASGIFAIIGQTGAGKSTILDAICLALYGQTPRLVSINSSSNLIMSKNTSECMSELVFSTTKGRFVCSWHQHRARKAIDGKLTEVKHEISNYETGEIIESKKSQVVKKIEDVTGMDFKRFTKSVLLEQGGFDKFLAADKDEKSKILEQITGTEIYTRISQAIFERQKEESNNLALLENDARNINILSQDDESNLDTQLADLSGKNLNIAKEIENYQIIEKWHQDISNIKLQKNNAQSNLDAANNAIEQFAPQFAKLQSGRMARGLEGAFATIGSLRQRHKEVVQNVEKLNKLIPDLEIQIAQSNHAKILANNNLEFAKKEYVLQKPNIDKIIICDTEITNKKQENSQLFNQINDLKTQLNATKTNRDAILKNQNAINAKIDAANIYLENNKIHSELNSELGIIEQKLANFIQINNSLEKLKTQLSKNETQIIGLKKDILDLGIIHKQYDQSFIELELEVKTLNDEIAQLLNGKILRECQTQIAHLREKRELALMVQNAEELRAKLRNNEPCPVCGSLEHPYSKGELPDPDGFQKEINEITKLIESINNLEKIIKEKENAQNSKKENIASINTDISIKNAILIEKENTNLELQSEISNMGSSLKFAHKEVLNLFHKYGVCFEIEKSESAIELIRQYNEKWKKLCAENENNAKEAINYEMQLAKINANLEDKISQLNEKSALCEIQKVNIEKLIQERHELFGDKEPKSYEQELNKAIETAQVNLTQILVKNEEINQKILSNSQQLEVQLKLSSKTKNELSNCEDDFSKNLTTKGFADENAFVAGLVPNEVLEQLEQKNETLQANLITNRANFDDANMRLETEIAKNLSKNQPQDDNAMLRELQNSHRENLQNITLFAEQLRQNANLKNIFDTKEKEIDSQKLELQKWQKLNKLIGSSDGKIYRNFAQGLTFEILISHANQQLAKMTERYLLARNRGDISNPFELDVIDNFQAGESRPIKNLSGGERFLISLALALGLSQMASDNVRVDSLFLDEGFGTLDEDALEAALETLSGLHQDGKIIGIISHIAALKEKIGTQIIVKQKSPGRSILTGAGIVKN